MRHSRLKESCKIAGIKNHLIRNTWTNLALAAGAKGDSELLVILCYKSVPHCVLSFLEYARTHVCLKLLGSHKQDKRWSINQMKPRMLPSLFKCRKTIIIIIVRQQEHVFTYTWKHKAARHAQPVYPLHAKPLNTFRDAHIDFSHIWQVSASAGACS